MLQEMEKPVTVQSITIDFKYWSMVSFKANKYILIKRQIIHYTIKCSSRYNSISISIGFDLMFLCQIHSATKRCNNNLNQKHFFINWYGNHRGVVFVVVAVVYSLLFTRHQTASAQFYQKVMGCIWTATLRIGMFVGNLFLFYTLYFRKMSFVGDTRFEGEIKIVSFSISKVFNIISE